MALQTLEKCIFRNQHELPIFHARYADTNSSGQNYSFYRLKWHFHRFRNFGRQVPFSDTSHAGSFINVFNTNVRNVQRRWVLNRCINHITNVSRFAKTISSSINLNFISNIQVLALLNFYNLSAFVWHHPCKLVDGDHNLKENILSNIYSTSITKFESRTEAEHRIKWQHIFWVLRNVKWRN